MLKFHPWTVTRRKLPVVVLICLAVLTACSEKAPSAVSEPPAEPAQPVVNKEKTPSSPLDIEMVRIEAGRFEIGTNENDPYFIPMERGHAVVIEKPFWLGKTEVTQAQWNAVMGKNPSHFKECGPNCPVENVTWFEIVDFANRLSEKSGLSKCYEGKGELTRVVPDCEGYRLPTEQEWEYAARAGTKGRFYTGDCLSAEQANFNATFSVPGCEKGVYREKTVEVGRFPPNPWKLFDIIGNVQEWTWSRYLPYPKPGEKVDDTPIFNVHRTVRGGGWKNGMSACRVAKREGFSPVYRDPNIGLRLARFAK